MGHLRSECDNAFLPSNIRRFFWLHRWEWFKRWCWYLTMSDHAGQCLGEGARRLASAESWTQVADLSGVSRQAVWSRWRV